MLNPNKATTIYVRGEPWPCNANVATETKGKTVTISAELSDAYVALLRAAEEIDWLQIRTLNEAVAQVLRAGGEKS